MTIAHLVETVEKFDKELAERMRVSFFERRTVEEDIEFVRNRIELLTKKVKGLESKEFWDAYKAVLEKFSFLKI